MNEFSTYEFVVEQKLEGKWILARIALLCFYVFYVLGFLLLGLRYRLIVPLIALIPISLWIIVFITWRYVDVEYEYSITSGELTFSKIYGNRSRRRLLVVTLRDAVTIAPLDGDIYSAKATAWKPEREYSAVSSLSAPDIYYMLFEYKDHSKKEKRRAILYFEATQRALQICRFYNPSGTVVTKTQR